MSTKRLVNRPEVVNCSGTMRNPKADKIEENRWNEIERGNALGKGGMGKRSGKSEE